MRTTFLLGSCLAVAVAAAGCRDSATAPARLPVLPRAGDAAQSVLGGRVAVDLDRLGLSTSARVADMRLGNAVARRVIDPNDYQCSTANLPLITWIDNQVNTILTQEPDVFEAILSYDMPDVPFVEAVLFETEATPQYFGYNGEYTNILQKTERDVKRFWDIPSGGIQLIGAHGTILLDVERVAATYLAAWQPPLTPAEAADFARIVRATVLRSRTLNGGNHPLFSFNASANPSFNESIPAKVIVGDGILAGYTAIGYADVAPQGIYAHEFGHQIQFANGYFDDPYATTGSLAERTRYTELMADAFSAYYLTHKRGAAMNRKRVEEFLDVFFQIGDCAFDNPGHHGTPNQRMAAARFGFDVADQAQKQGQILTAEQFHALFVAVYPTLIAPDRL